MDRPHDICCGVRRGRGDRYRAASIRGSSEAGVRDALGDRTGRWQQALVDAYPELPPLKRMLSEQLDRNLSRISLAESLDGVAQQLIARANAEGWVYDLILAARRDNPGNDALRDFALELPSASGT